MVVEDLYLLKRSWGCAGSALLPLSQTVAGFNPGLEKIARSIFLNPFLPHGHNGRMRFSFLEWIIHTWRSIRCSTGLEGLQWQKSEVRRFSVSFLVCFHVEFPFSLCPAGFSPVTWLPDPHQVWAAGKMDGSVLLELQHFLENWQIGVNGLRESRSTWAIIDWG